ncbi:hypothetical protein EV175_006291 [Coemansia sp. RSA 1933]|nr:hypothetical protein EV175_006291 [Coemansia sp. RSA 1933]
MAAATASGNTAQIDQLERMAKAREQELAAQEARLKQQQEEIRKQAMFLQQQQQNLLQMQQSQKVEAQLKQLKEEKDRLEQQRQAEELKKQVDILRAQQQQMLKMQQMATQARGAMAAGGSISQPQTVSAQQNQQQQQIGSNANVFATNGMFGVSQGITNIPAASTSSAGLTAVPARGIFSNHAVAGSTPNLGSFANTKPLLNAPVGVGNANGIGSGYSNNIAATHSVTNFGTFNNNMQGTPQQQQQQQMNQFMQQKQLMMSSNGQQFNATANKYDIFKSVNPHGPSVFTGDVQQNLMLGNVNTQQQLMPNNALGGNAMPAGFVMNNQSQQQQSSGPRPTGIFAMANPTLSQPQQQQAGLQQNMFQNQAFGAQQGQQQPQQQMFGMNQQSGNVNGFGGQVQWR